MQVIDLTTDSWTKEEVLGVAADYRTHAEEVFLQDGYHRPMSFVFGTKHHETGEKLKALSLVPVFGEFHEDSKDGYSKALREVVRLVDGVGIIFITEMWMVTGIGGPDSPAARKWRGKLHQHPERTEHLMLSCEHSRFGCRMWAAQISRPPGEPEGKPSLGPWLREGRFPLTDPEPRDIRRMGRFVNILPQVS